MTAPGLCLLGTDTGVGKTTLACGILRLARRKSFRLVPFKPVETGCSASPTDGDRLVQAAARPDFQPPEVGIYRFAHPLAPSIAARLAGQSIDVETIVQRAGALVRNADGLLVETAGGLLTPYGPGLTSASLVQSLVSHFVFDVLLVSANRLGTINQTALALDHLARVGCRVGGVVLVDTAAQPSPDQPFNADEIRALTGAPILGTLRHCPTLDPDAIAAAVAADLDLGPLRIGAALGA